MGASARPEPAGGRGARAAKLSRCAGAFAASRTQSRAAAGDAWRSILRSGRRRNGAGQGPLTPETDYRTARTSGGSPGQTSEDSLTEQPRVSAVPKAISAAANTCGGFPGRTETGILS